MGIGFRGLMGAAALVAASTIGSSVAVAQERTDAEVVLIEVQPIPEVFEDAFFDDSGTYFENRSIFRQADLIIGSGVPAAFPELEIERDARRIHELYEELLALQVSSDPVIRTPDLASPFSTSILLLPVAPAGSRVVGTELQFEPIPFIGR